MSYIDRVRERLAEASERGELSAIHCDPSDRDAFIVGFAESIDRNGFVLRMVDTHGRDDGFQPTRWDEVLAFHVGTEYLGRVAALREHPIPPINTPPELPTDPVKALEFAHKHRLVVSLRDSDDSHQGYVHDIGDGWVEVEPIEESGRIDGIHLLNLDQVDRVRIAGYDERELERLHRIRYGG